MLVLDGKIFSCHRQPDDTIFKPMSILGNRLRAPTPHPAADAALALTPRPRQTRAWHAQDTVTTIGRGPQAYFGSRWKAVAALALSREAVAQRRSVRLVQLNSGMPQN